MEEDIRKQGMLFVQQQRFGKKWKRVWSVLYREGTRSISRLEFWECKDGGNGTLERSDRSLKKQQEHKKVIRLCDCIRVTEVEMEGCPRDCAPFLVETTEKVFVFAAELAEVDEWTQRLCEIAFPLNWGDRGGAKRSSVQRTKEEAEQGMEDNSLYSGRDTVRDFRVVVRRTEASDRCRLRGPCILRTDFNSLILKDTVSGDVLYKWPYRFLRRFGRDKVTFSFEAGRRCDSGEGSFEFDTKQGNTVFQAVEIAINLQRTSQPLRQTSEGLEVEPSPESRPLPQPATEPGMYSTVKQPTLQPSPPPPHQPGPPPRLEPPVDKLLTGVKSLTLDTRSPPPRKNQVKTICSCPLPKGEGQTYSVINLPTEREVEQGEHSSLPHNPHHPPDPEYSLPFDTIAKKFMSDISTSQQSFGRWVTEQGSDGPGCKGDEARDPLYDSIDESVIRSALMSRAEGSKPAYQKAEHIYDEPEGCALLTLKPSFPASVYDDPEEVKGHAWRLMGTVVDPNGHEYPYNPQVDDYAVPKPPRRAFPPGMPNQDAEEDSPYDNVMVKMDRENR